MNKDSQFHACLQKAVEERLFPGCSFVYLDSQEEIIQAFGRFTNDEESSAITPDTLYDSASITKIVATMTLALVLLDEGVLSLDDKVGKYLPEYRVSEYKQMATILHLMTYTLDYDIPVGAKERLPQLTAQQIANDVLSNSLIGVPGKSYRYTNITAFLLTQVIEKATGRKFDDLVQEKVFDPLQMCTATFCPRNDQALSIPPTEVTVERGEVRGFVHDEFTYYTRRGGVSNGAAGLFVSIRDLKKFLQMTIGLGVFEGRRLVSNDLVKKWTEDVFPELLPTHTPLSWGDLNNSLIDSYHREIVVKGGFTGCFMLADLRERRAYALLSNRTYPTRPTDSTSFAKLKKDLTDIALG